MLLVVDSSVAIRAASSKPARAVLVDHELLAPPLLWSEVHSATHAALWRGDLSEQGATALLDGLGAMGIRRRSPAGLHREAFRIATELGWAKTYDAEFLALARIEEAVVLSTDARLVRGAARTGLVIGPSSLT